MQAWQWFGAALQPWSRGKNQRAWVEYCCLLQVLEKVCGLTRTRTQFNTRIIDGMVVPILAVESVGLILLEWIMDLEEKSKAWPEWYVLTHGIVAWGSMQSYQRALGRMLKGHTLQHLGRGLQCNS